MKGRAKRTMYVQDWSFGPEMTRKVATPSGTREIKWRDHIGMQLRQGEIYEIPDDRPDLLRHFTLLIKQKPKVEKPPAKKPAAKKTTAKATAKKEVKDGVRN